MASLPYQSQPLMQPDTAVSRTYNHTTSNEATIIRRKPIPQNGKKNKFDGGISDIVWASSLIVLPMLIISAVFIALTFRWQVLIPNQHLDQVTFSRSYNIVNDSEASRDVFYVDISSTRLLTVASWTSTLCSFLPSWVMLLVSYPLAKQFLRDHTDRLPTPFQLRLLIDLCTGNYGSLWAWFTYRTPAVWNWFLCRVPPSKKKRANTPVAVIVSILVLSAILGLCILLADTWLHLTTTTVLLQETQLNSNLIYDFSRTLAPSCQGSQSATCTVQEVTPVNQNGAILNASRAYQTMFNVSADTSIFATSVNGQIYSFYAPAHIPSNLTYRASTIGVNTQCTAITKVCNLTEQTVDRGWGILSEYTSLPFYCNLALQGDLAGSLNGSLAVPNASFYVPQDNAGFFLMYFMDSGLTQPYNPGNDLWNLENDFDGPVTDTTYFVEYKPTYFAIGATVAASPQIMSSPNVVNYTASQTAAFLLACSSQFLQLSYTFSSEDTSITNVVASPASDDAIMAVTNPLLIQDTTPQTGLVLGLRQAAFESSVDALTAGFARTYSRIVLSMGVGAVVSSPNLQEMVRSTRQITRMPKAPFLTLIALNGVYVLLGMTLTVIAFKSGPRVVKPVQARLTTTGLVAALFEDRRADRHATEMKQLFEEFSPESSKGSGSCPKAGMERTAEGGWRFRKIRPVEMQRLVHDEH